ncbi:phage antirepressor KilAC domain-containing protein [Brevibacillus thermoruber]|uniref:phage antirepressor KilAC domain-containing protein n=1 Tax=Brevibacillus thermoruber TaxID=33942 RepID=UPI000419BF92|nr:phage antirepressor KilAC domain-containing protein [Brevibacillus thermoruber]
MNSLQKMFAFEGKEVRVIMQDGEPRFVAKDVCDVLEIGNSRMALERLSPSQKGVSSIDTPGGVQQMSVINEAGLYKLIFTSRKPEAQKFADWVAEEVLPTIRKTGGYVANEDLFIATYLPHADESTKLLFRATLETVRKQNEKIAVMEPKAEMFDVFLSAENTQTISDVAKSLDEGPRKLLWFLRDQKVLMQRGGDYVPYQQYIDRGYFEVVQRPVDTGRSVINRKETRVTPKGVEFIARLLKSPKQVASGQPVAAARSVTLRLNPRAH